MSTSDPEREFRELMGRVRVGDSDAAAELVRRFEPEIRREVRIRLTDPKLRRVVDSMDICQSVLGNFLVRVTLGQFEIEHPNQLFRLLATMARNKVIDRYRNEQVRLAAQNKHAPNRAFDRLGEPLDHREGPDSVALSRELLCIVIGKLTQEEREIIEMRQQDRSWAEISLELGVNEAALRKKISRACDRVMQGLNIS